MKEKEQIVLKFLSSQESWVTSFSISAYLNISVRTVKSYVRDINTQFPGLIESSRNGFRISNNQLLSEALNTSKANEVPQTMEDRRKYILRKLLLEEKSFGMDALAEELCISSATLFNELPKLKEELGDYELVFKTKHSNATILGEEANKKRLLSKLIYEDTEGEFLSIRQMQRYLPSFDLSVVREFIAESLSEHHYFIDDFSLLNLVLHIGIILERNGILERQVEERARSWEPLIKSHIHEIAFDITKKIGNYFKVTFQKGEVYDLALLIMTRAISEQVNELDSLQLSDIVSSDVLDLVSLMQRKTKETYGISITNPDFTMRFSLHIQNMLLRLEHNIILRNPQMKDIKNMYPFIYDVAVFISDILLKEYGYLLSEDEIAYIALHLGVLIEERKVIKHDVRAILLNPQYFYKSVDMVTRFSTVFEEGLMITNIVSREEELEEYNDNEYDMVISTIALQNITDKPWVHISSYLNNKDIFVISKKIEDVLKARVKSKVESKLKTMFRESLFFFNRRFDNNFDAISEMSDSLEIEGCVDSEFKVKLYEREKVSPSSFLNIAMPHPLEMCALKSGIAVSIHPSPLDWNGNKVNIIFMLAIHIEDNLFFKDIFDFITEVISEEKRLKKILECKTFDEFIETLVGFAR